MDDRTQDQRDADVALRVAVERVTTAYGHLPDGALMQDFVVLGRGIRYDDDGDPVAHTFTLFPDATMDPTLIMGHIGRGFFEWGMFIASPGEPPGED